MDNDLMMISYYRVSNLAQAKRQANVWQQLLKDGAELPAHRRALPHEPHMVQSHFAGHIISLELIICLFLTANWMSKAGKR